MTTTDARISTVMAVRLHATDAAAPDPAKASAMRRALHATVSESGGQESGNAGDVFLAEFTGAVDAIQGAEALGASLADVGAAIASIGISLGEIHRDGDALYGDAVDAALALQKMAAPGSVIVSAAVQEQARLRTDLAFRRVRPRAGEPIPVSAYVLTGRDTAGSRLAFLQELARRRIFRAAGAYIFVSWVLVQAASIVFPEFGFPTWSMRALIIVLTVFFPLAMLVAWSFDLTGSGFALTPDSNYSRARGNVLRFAMVGTATVMSAAVVWWAWNVYVEPPAGPVRGAVKANPVIAVNPMQRLAAPDSVEWVGEGVAELIRNDLAESRYVIVLSQARWASMTADATTSDELIRIAQQANIDYLIDGNYLQTPDGLVLTARIEDLEAGSVLRGMELRGADAAGIIGGTSQLGLQIKRALGIPFLDTVTHYSADFAVDNLAAYEAYVAGLGYLAAFDYQQAEDSFAAALRLAPDFHIARFRLSKTLEATGRTELSRAELDRIPDDADLTRRERLYIDGAKHAFFASRDPAMAIEVYGNLYREYPYDIEAGQLLADAYWLDFQEDASIALYQELAEMHPYEPTSWMAVGERLLDVGRLTEADAALTRYRAMSPDDHYAIALLGNLRQLEGNYGASIPFYEESLQHKPGFPVAALGLARSRYLLGDVTSAEAQFRAIIGDEAQALQFRIDAAFDLAGIRRGRGLFADSSAILEGIAEAIRADGVRAAEMDAMIGLNALELGETERAKARIDKAVAEAPQVATGFLFARGLFELRTGDLPAVDVTAAEIAALALPVDDPDRTEDKASAFLLGLAALERNDPAAAAIELESIIGKDGYEYAVYTAGLARLRQAQGRLPEATQLAADSSVIRSGGDLRLDLELDRTRALLLHAELLAARGLHAEARERAELFIARFDAGVSSPEIAAAREFLSAE